MGIDIDFLAVGNGKYCGDAIALRFGDLQSADRSRQKVVVIDGGTKQSGAELVSLIKTHYGTDVVDLVISTHPDRDHVSGLTEVLDSLTVRKLWMHTPWENAHEIKDLFKDGRITGNSLKERLREGLQAAHDLFELARDKGVPVEEPFTGMTFGDVLTVLGPTSDYYYTELVPNFECTPAPAENVILKEFAAKASEAMSWLKENVLGQESLTDEGTTSASNNSSTICLLNVDGHRVLLTGDAGMPSLDRATDYAEQTLGIDLKDLHFMQVPHHGSDHNVGPSTLNRITTSVAFISSPPEGDPKHPSRKVVNALIRRGAKVYKTAGVSLWHNKGSVTRDGYGSATSLAWFEWVES